MTVATYNDGRDLILQPLHDAWQAADYGPILYTDVGGKVPDSNVVWARAILRHVSGGQASLACFDGKSRWANQGTLFVQVFGPIGDGSTAAYDAAQLVASAYKGKRSGGVWFRNPRINEVGTTGDFEQINFMTEFNYDQIG